MNTKARGRRSTKSKRASPICGRHLGSRRSERGDETLPNEDVLRGAGAASRRIGMGLVGPGFVGTHHIDAVRRLGFVEVVAVAASSERSPRAKADALGVPKAYGSYEALAADPDIDVVHNTTPNNLHVPVIMA